MQRFLTVGTVSMLSTAAAVMAAPPALLSDVNGASSASTQYLPDFSSTPWSQSNGTLNMEGQGGVWSTNTSLQHGVFSASGSSGWTVRYSPEQPGIGGAWSSVAFSGIVSSESSYGFDPDEPVSTPSSNAHQASVSILFSISEESTWSFSASVAASCEGFSSVVCDAVFQQHVPDPGCFGCGTIFMQENRTATLLTPSFDETLTFGGTIPPGEYIFSFQVTAGEFYLGQVRDVGGAGEVTVQGGVFRVDPASTPACRADFDGNGAVAIDDIFAFLNAWFGDHPRGDFDDNGQRTIDDIFVFLNAWFAGCP